MQEIELGKGKHALMNATHEGDKCFFIVKHEGDGVPGNKLDFFKIGGEIYPDKYEGTVLRFKNDDAIKQVVDYLVSSLDDSELAHDQVGRLANFIMAEVSGEPSQDEGAIDTAIRIIRNCMASRLVVDDDGRIRAVINAHTPAICQMLDGVDFCEAIINEIKKDSAPDNELHIAAAVRAVLRTFGRE